MIPPNHNGWIYSGHQTEWQISSRFLEASDVALKLSTAAWNVFFLIFAARGLWKLAKITSMAEDYCRNLCYVCYAFKQDYFIPLLEKYVESQSALLTLKFAE